MAELATRNDPAIGRKGVGAPQPLTPPEKDWMRAATVLVAVQLGVVNVGAVPTARTMADLPTI